MNGFRFARRFFWLVICLLIAAQFGVVSGQAAKQPISKKNLPAAVLAAFTKNSSEHTIKAVLSKKVGDEQLYEIEAIEKGKRRGWIFSADGNLVETEEAIKVSQLPAAVKDTVKREHPNLKIDKAEKVSRDGNVIAYEVEAERGIVEVEMRIAPDGKVIEAEQLRGK